MSGDELTMRLESPRQEAVMRLLADLDSYLQGLYPPESNHLLDIEELCEPSVRFFVARAGERVLGCGAMRIAADYTELKRMYVSPDSRGSGLGMRLLVCIENEARQLGMHCMRLETGIHQPEAIALYRKAGYIERAPFGSYQLDPLSLFMERSLD